MAGLYMEYHRFWQYLGVPADNVLFGDLRHITNGWECVRQGYDIRTENICNGGPMTYPGLWVRMHVFGLGPEVTVPFGVLLVVWFYFSLWLILPALSTRESLIYAAVLVSPSAMLAIERGNNDMIMFSLTALAIRVLARNTRLSAFLAAAALLLASFLKLYPIAAAYVTLHQKSIRRSLATFAGICVAFTGFLILSRDDIRTVRSIVPEPEGGWAYGATTMGLQLSALLRRFAGEGAWNSSGAIAWSAIVAGVAAGWLLARRWSTRPLATSPGVAFLAFQAGAGVYVFTYLVASNWDYRLIFLLLTLPQILAWRRNRANSPTAHSLAVAAILGSCWLGFFYLGAYHSAIEVSVNLNADQFLQWFVYAYLVATLFRTSPLWLRQRVGLADREAHAT